MIADVLTNGQDLFGVTRCFRAGQTLSPLRCLLLRASHDLKCKRCRESLLFVFISCCKSFYSMGGILILTWAAKRAIVCRNVFAHCHTIALSALLAVPCYLRTHTHT